MRARAKQNRLVFTRVGAVVDWYMLRGSRGGYGKLVRRIFSILEDRGDSAATTNGGTIEYFLVEGGFNLLNRLHLHGTALHRLPLASRALTRVRVNQSAWLPLPAIAEHESHLLGRSTSLDQLRDILAKRVEAISEREGSHTHAVVERLAWPGVEPAELFDERDREILGGVPTFSTPTLMFPSLGARSSLRPSLLPSPHRSSDT
jgi:hypothetical protein